MRIVCPSAKQIDRLATVSPIPPVSSLFVPPPSASDCSTWEGGSESDAFRLCGDAFRVIEGISQSGSGMEWRGAELQSGAEQGEGEAKG